MFVWLQHVRKVYVKVDVLASTMQIVSRFTVTEVTNIFYYICSVLFFYCPTADIVSSLAISLNLTASNAWNCHKQLCWHKFILPENKDFT